MLLGILSATAADGDYYGDNPPAQTIVLPGYSPEEARQRLIDDPDSGYNNLEPYESPVPTGDPLEPFDPSLDPDEPAERKDVVVV